MARLAQASSIRPPADSRFDETFSDDSEPSEISDEALMQLYPLSRQHNVAHLVGNAIEKLGLLPACGLSEQYAMQVLQAHHQKELLTHQFHYQLRYAASHDIDFRSEDGVRVELHFELVEDRRVSAAYEVLSSVWEHTHPQTPGRYLYVMMVAACVQGSPTVLFDFRPKIRTRKEHSAYGTQCFRSRDQERIKAFGSVGAAIADARDIDFYR